MEPHFVVPISASVAAELGRRIKASEQKAVRHFLETARLCDLGLKRYRTHGLPVLLRAADMSKSAFMMFVSAANDEDLRRIQPFLTGETKDRIKRACRLPIYRRRSGK
jgi:hypothetical protein